MDSRCTSSHFKTVLNNPRPRFRSSASPRTGNLSIYKHPIYRYISHACFYNHHTSHDNTKKTDSYTSPFPWQPGRCTLVHSTRYCNCRCLKRRYYKLGPRSQGTLSSHSRRKSSERIGNRWGRPDRVFARFSPSHATRVGLVSSSPFQWRFCISHKDAFQYFRNLWGVASNTFSSRMIRRRHDTCIFYTEV